MWRWHPEGEHALLAGTIHLHALEGSSKAAAIMIIGIFFLSIV
jgi:hypothetical protein